MYSFSPSPRNEGGARTRPLHDFTMTYEDGKLVMVIDDSPMICRIVEFSYGHYGVNTVTFYSGIDAINALKNGAVPVPDLVLLDIGMPHMSGYDVAMLLSSNEGFGAVPIVMLSGHDGIFNRIRAKRAGADDFIRKPFKKRELISKTFPLLNLEIPDDSTIPQD